MKRLRNLFKRLTNYAQNDFLADSEQQSDRNGYLSYRAEWHSAAWGFAAGFMFGLTGNEMYLMAGVGWLFTSSNSRPKYLPYPKQFVKESGYLVGHAVAGVLVGLLLRVV